MHYYKFNIGDYARSTRHLSNEEDLAYRRLLDMYYENEAPIPLETQWVARRIRVASEVVDIVLQDMFERTEDGWKHARCDAEISEYQRNAERNRENGKRGGRPKSVGKKPKENPVGSQSDASGNPVVTLNTNHKPETINHNISSSKEDVSSGDDPLSVDEVVEAWNDIAERRKLPKVAKITPERRRKLKARIEQNTIDEWRLALDAIDRSSFLCGDNDRGWKANFDFLLQPSSFTKLIEGAYDR